MFDNAGFGELDHLDWATEAAHTDSGTERQSVQHDHGTWYRVVRDGREVVRPTRHRGGRAPGVPADRQVSLTTQSPRSA